jgi:hypothetical protein
VLLGFRNKTGFHECPQCKSRSVWKADPYGTLEETLHRVLRLSPYRCARCDRRFMDSKIPVPGAPPRLMRRWLSRASIRLCRLRHQVWLRVSSTARSRELSLQAVNPVASATAEYAPERQSTIATITRRVLLRSYSGRSHWRRTIVLTNPILRRSRATIPPVLRHARHRSQSS